MATNNSVNEPTAASGKVLQGAGVGTVSAFSTATYPAVATGTGTILRADGTNWVATTSTYPNTNAVSTLLYASSANVMGALATGNDGVLITSHTGVPSLLANGTTGQALIATASSPPTWGTVPVAGGGTGLVTTTAYGTICGGTTATGNFQNAGAGSSGQYLQSFGAAALPQWQNAPLFQVSVTLTSAQIKALTTTPITLLDAQGAGVTSQIVSVGSYFTYGGTNAFTNGAAINLKYVNNSGTSIASSIGTTTQMRGTVNYVVMPLLTAIAAASSLTDNSLICICSTTTAYAGNAAADNTLTVYATYLII